MTDLPKLKIRNKQRASETGSALVYILIAIALLAALTVSFMEPSSQQTSSQNSFKTTASLQGQIDTIRSAIQECVLLYPTGDSTIPDGASDGYNKPFPLDADSSHLDASYQATAGNKRVSELRCPGDNDGTANQHLKIFSGGSGKFLPPPPDLFVDWQYYNGPEGVFYWTETTKSDAFLAAALAKLDEKFSPCEADVIDATSGAVNLVTSGTDLDGNAGVIQCSANSTCFRVWLVTDTDNTALGGTEGSATSVYPDETACNTP